MPKFPLKVNIALDRSPLLFSFFPTHLLIPCGCFLTFSAVLFLWFKAQWLISVVVFATLTISWMVLTARGTHTFLSRFDRPPYWIRAIHYRQPILGSKYQRHAQENETPAERL
jgi:hypothetical protein